jgi:chromosome segregation ATPase
MSIPTIIDRVLGKQRERQSARLAGFAGIVREIADGHEPDADLVDGILRDAGKTLDDLRTAVEKLQHRRELKARLDRLPKLAAQRKDVERQMIDANRALEQAEERHVEVTNPLQMHLQDLKEQIWAGEQARSTCEDEALRARLDEVVAHTAEAHREAAALRAGIERSRDLAQADRQRADSLVFAKRSDDLRKRAQEYDAEVVHLQTRLKAVEKELASLQKQEAAIRDEMLVP